MTGTHVWEPRDDYWQGTRLQAVMQALGSRSYSDFYRASIETPDTFWDATLSNIGHEWIRSPSRLRDLSSCAERPVWFPGGLANVTHNAVMRWLPARAQDIAIISVAEDGSTATRSFSEIAADMQRFAASLVDRGVRRGDRVGFLMPYDGDAAVALLAVAHIGAVAVPMFTGFAPPAIAQRLEQSSSSFILSTRCFVRGGKNHDLVRAALEATARMSRPVQTLVFEDLAGHRSRLIEPSPMSASDPLLVAFTSGTSGRPKGAVHTHLGLPVKACQELTQLMDLGPGSRLLRITDMGWVGGSYTILSGLMAGATLVMYAGSPTYPTPRRVLELVNEYRVTHLGIAPTWARMLRQWNGSAELAFHTDTLRFTSSVGEAWDPATYAWYTANVGTNELPVINHSGGTEVGNLLACVPCLPIVGGSFNTAVPGVPVDVVGTDGVTQLDQTGDLVVRGPFLGMTNGLWNEADRYVQTYWRRHPGMWDQGDLATRGSDGYWTLDGRSDDRLKISGRGLMPEEIEQILSDTPGVTASVAVAFHSAETGSAMALVIEADTANPEQLKEHAKQAVRKTLGAAFVPHVVLVVDRLPRTQSGKVTRRAVSTVARGETFDSTGLTEQDATALSEISLLFLAFTQR